MNTVIEVASADFEVVVIDDIVFSRSKDGYLEYEGKCLGSLKWGHPALVAAMGQHFKSIDAWDAWFQTAFKK